VPQTGKDQRWWWPSGCAMRCAPALSAATRDEFEVSASIGLATYPHDARDAHDIIRQARRDDVPGEEHNARPTLGLPRVG